MQQLSLPIMLARRRAAAAAGSIAAPQEELAQASQLQAPPVQAQPVSEAQPQRQEASHGTDCNPTPHLHKDSPWVKKKHDERAGKKPL